MVKTRLVHLAGTYQGIQDGWPSPPKLARNVWHPEPDEESDKSESWKNQYGYPSIAGFLTAAIEPVNAEGSAWPWYAGFGNHDEAGQTMGDGASSEDQLAAALRTGDQLPLALPPGMNRSQFFEAAEGDTDFRQELLASMPSRTVTGTKMRRLFSESDFFEAVSRSDGNLNAASTENASYFSFELSEHVLGIMLNTANPEGGSRAVIDSDQAGWLEDQLLNASGTFYDEEGNVVTSESTNRLVVIFSHHTSQSFGDRMYESDSDVASLTRDDRLEFMARYPNVVLWMNGHRHRHKVVPHPGKSAEYGFVDHHGFPD